MGGNSQFVLGTAQLGLDYGIANRVGRPSKVDAFELLDSAWERGLRYFDTAQAYGESENIIGRWVKSRGVSDAVKIFSKLPPSFRGTESDVIDSVEESCGRLGVERLFGFAFHGESLIESMGGAVLMAVKEAGLASSVGVSVVKVDEAIKLLGTDGVEALQVPSNVYDRRLVEHGFFEKAKAHSVSTIVRSVFLQGLVLMNPKDVPKNVKGGKEAVAEFRGFCREFQVPPEVFALGFVGRVIGPDFVVIGADSAEQVERNVKTLELSYSIPSSTYENWCRRSMPQSSDLLDPFNWGDGVSQNR